MNLDYFKGHNVVYAKNQPQYKPLPAYKCENDPNGQIVCCWKLSFMERIKLLLTGRLWHSIFTFHASLQPQYLSVDSPFVDKK